jgi:hypothetical protein
MTTPTPTNSPSPSPSPSPTPEPTPPQTTSPLPTPTASINPNEFYASSSTFPLWAVAAAAIIGVTLLATFLIGKKQQSTESADDFNYE